MTRETRFNLIFLIVICALMAPGAAMLFLKKLDPNEPPMYLPQPVHKTLAFNDPRSAPPRVRRVIGPITRAWLTSLSAPPTNPATADPTPADGEPMAPAATAAGPDEPTPYMSAARTFQLADCRATPDGWTVSIIIWNPVALPRTPSLVWISQLDCGAEGMVVSQPMQPMYAAAVPPDVRRELQDAGYVQPSQVVLLGRAVFQSDLKAGACQEFTLTANGQGVQFQETAVWPPTWPVMSANRAVQAESAQ